MSDHETDIECTVCGESVAEDTVTQTEAYGEVCEDCIADSFVTLADGELLPEDEAACCASYREYFREDETFVCECCQDTYHQDFANCTYEGEMICSDCTECGDYVWCEDTGALHNRENVHYCDSEGMYFWDPDNVVASQDTYGVYSYDADILNVMDHTAWVNGKAEYTFGSKLLLGVELETATRDCYQSDIANAIRDTDFEDYGIMKHDGSIDGIELVTLPADLASHKSEYSWDDWCEALRPVAKGHYGANNGMHIHVNRAAISQLTLGKLLVFVNSPDNAELLSIIAQRDLSACHWCALHPMLYSKIGTSGKRGNLSGKYSAINVTRNTVEFRIFNATLLSERIYKNLEFCVALIKYCEQTGARDLSAEGFEQYTQDERKQFPELSKFIRERSIWPRTILEQREAA